MQTIPFISWDFIHSGACAWSDDERRVPCDVPHGIELQVEPARISQPILEADRPWEANNVSWVQVMQDNDLYRMWYGVSARHEGKSEYLCYAESDDGLDWRKPELGIVEVDGSAANNIVWEARGASHCCVFRDPSAPEDARYRCLTLSVWCEGDNGEEIHEDEALRRLNVNNTAARGTPPLPVELKMHMVGLNSPDGLHWTKIEKPILDEWHDSHNICRYDEAKGKYVGYFRAFYQGRRAVGYAETEDFENWPPTRVIHHQIISDKPGDSVYSFAYTKYPGSPHIHLMFPAMYDLSDDGIEGHLAVSTDGVNWSRHTGTAAIPRGKPGEPHEAFVYPGPDLLCFHDETRFRVPVRAGCRYHNRGYNKTFDKGEAGTFFAWAEWTEHRLAGIHAAEEGAFTVGMQCGDRLLANFRTEPDGWVRFELVDRVTWPPVQADSLEGYRFEDTEPINGDETHACVSWRDQNALPDMKGVFVRVRLCKATLFSLTMYGVDDPGVRDDPRYPV